MTHIKFTASPKGRFAKAGEKGYNTTLDEISAISKSIAIKHKVHEVFDWSQWAHTQEFER